MISEDILCEKYDTCFAIINEIHQLFIDEFTEDKVDMQIPKTISFNAFKRYFSPMEFTEAQIADINTFISWFNTYNITFYVYWPTVKISNETNKSHLIRDLYAKVPVSIKGLLLETKGFTLNRTTFTQAEWDSDYLHSHIPGIGKATPAAFKTPCTGHGPINAAIDNLKRAYDKDWFADFLYELNRYVYVESIAGVPYRRLGNIHLATERDRSNRRITLYLPYSQTFILHLGDSYKILLSDFLSYALHNFKFNFNFDGTKYLYVESANEFWLKLSNLFIDWFNEHGAQYNMTLSDLTSNDILIHCVWDTTGFCITKPPTYSSIDAIGKKILTFKGTPKFLDVIQRPLAKEEDEENNLYLLNKYFVGNLYNKLPNIINQQYGRD